MTDFQKVVSELIEQGLAVSEISKQLDCPISSVSSVIKALKLTVKKKLTINNVNHNYFDNIDSDDKAYFLGFIIADGSISSGTNSHDGNGRFSINIMERRFVFIRIFKITVTL